MPDGHDVLSWLHIGDLHIARETEQTYLDLKRIVDLAKGLPAGSVDFALLPGDNADDGTPEQFRLVRDAVAPLPMPLHILPGDHDFKPRALDAFYDMLGAEHLPKSVTAQEHRCLFLDVVSAGAGGPDFRLGDAQLAWAERQLEETELAGQDAIVFMHTYPADLQEGAERLGALLAKPHVTCVHGNPVDRADRGGATRFLYRCRRWTRGKLALQAARFSLALRSHHASDRPALGHGCRCGPYTAKPPYGRRRLLRTCSK